MISDFLNTKISKDNLIIALNVIYKFKECESLEEWAYDSFESWDKLELLQKYLEKLTGVSGQ